jgi:hypothetical protein
VLVPIAGGPLAPPGSCDAVDPRSASLASGGRALEEPLLELPPPLAGVLKRFNAVASEVPPAAVFELEVTAGAAAGAVDESVAEPAEASLPELGAAVVEEDELVCPEGRKVGVLEMAAVLARAAEGSAVLGPRRVPRS